MLPDWSTLQAAWPLLLGLAALWARIEVALARTRDRSHQQGREIEKLDLRVTAQAEAASLHAVQLGRIEATLIAIERTLERLDHKIADR
jgi:hypothetical protein